jgi:hypothetical protein
MPHRQDAYNVPHSCNRNVSKLPLHFTIKATHPFAVVPASLGLQPGESAAVSVGFDPNYRGDQTSHTVKQRCLISYPDNPQKDWLDLTGIIEFPNLVFDTQNIDFGCVLMDSMKRTTVQVTNPGTRPVCFSWSWLKQAPPEAQDAAGGFEAHPRVFQSFHLALANWLSHLSTECLASISCIEQCRMACKLPVTGEAPNFLHSTL